MTYGTPRCAACGEATVYEEELGSAVCSACGTLVDPAQAQFERATGDTSGRDYARYDEPNNAARTTLKGRGGWALAGQDKEARERRNRIAMHEYVRSLANRMSTPGAATRGQGLFDQVMQRGQFRWGRRAKLVAGASIAIALREMKKGGSLRDIAYLLDEPFVALTRTFTTAIELLGLKLDLTDPAEHLRALENYLVTLLQPGPAQTEASGSAPHPTLSQTLHSFLTSLLPSLPTIHTTATSLASLTPHIPALSGLPTPPTACAALMLALEAERGTSLPGAQALAGALGGRVGVKSGAVMGRYRVLAAAVEEWATEVPWVEGYVKGKGDGKENGAGKGTGKTKGKGKDEGRAKVAKRVVVARAVKDVLQFREEIWRRRMEGVERPVLEIEVDPGEEGDFGAEEDSNDGNAGGGVRERSANNSAILHYKLALEASLPASPTPTPSDARGGKECDATAHAGFCPLVPARLHKKPRRTAHQRKIEHVSQFLLNPLGSSTTPTPTPIPAAPSPTSTYPAPDLATHLLTTPSPSLSSLFTQSHPPTRLQLLAAARPGGETEIADEELFEEGEMEGMIREGRELEAVRAAMGWDQDFSQDEDEEENETNEQDESRGRKRKRKRDDSADGRQDAAVVGSSGGTSKRATKRINMDALAYLLDPDTHLDEDGEDFSGIGFGLGLGLDEHMGGESAMHVMGDPDEEVIEEWRPLSPGPVGHGGYDEGRYDV